MTVNSTHTFQPDYTFGFQATPETFPAMPTADSAVDVTNPEETLESLELLSAYPCDILWNTLLEKEIIDDKGKLIKPLDPILTLAAEDTSSLYDFLNIKRYFKLQNCSFECSLFDVLTTLLNKCGAYIENIDLIDDGANFFWKKESILHLLAMAGIEDPNFLPIDELTKNFHSPLNSLSIRIELKDSASSFAEEGFEKGLEGLTRKIQHELELFIYAHIKTSRVKPTKDRTLIQPINKRISHTPSEESKFFFKFLGKFPVDLCFFHHLNLPFENEQDWCIDLRQILKTPTGKTPPLAQVSFSTAQGWEVLFSKLLGQSKPFNPTENTLTRLPKHLVHQVKGGTVFERWDEESFIEGYVHILENSQLKENLADIIWRHLKVCLKKHIGNNPMGRFCFVFSYCRALEGKMDKKILFSVWKKYAARALLEENQDSFQKMIMACCLRGIGEEKWNFQQVSQLLLTMFLIMDKERAIPPSVRIFLTKNNDKECMQVNYCGVWPSSLLIYLHPDTDQVLSDITHPLCVSDDFLQLIISKEKGGSHTPLISDNPFNFEKMTAVLAHPSTYILGYRLWVSMVAFTPLGKPFSPIENPHWTTDPHLPLIYLTKSPFPFPEEMLGHLQEIALLEEHREFFSTLAKLHARFPDHSWLVKCIGAMIPNKNMTIQRLGNWQLSDLLKDNSFLKNRPQEAACLFWCCQYFEHALKVFSACDLPLEERGIFLLHLVNLADTASNRNELLTAFEIWLHSHTPQSNPINALLLLQYAKIIFKTNPNKCFALWANFQGASLWDFLPTTYEGEYHHLLISLFHLVDAQSQGIIASALEKMQLNRIKQELFHSLKPMDIEKKEKKLEPSIKDNEIKFNSTILPSPLLDASQFPPFRIAAPRKLSHQTRFPLQPLRESRPTPYPLQK